MGHTDLKGIDEPFTEEEVKSAVDQMASDKAPSPDGFTSAFSAMKYGGINRSHSRGGE